MAHMLKQRYFILNKLGQGGMGAVYKAEDTSLGNRLVAIKEMSQRGLDPQEIILASQAFKQEAHMLAGLHHPHLPSIHEHFEEAGRWYLVMSFIEGETLESYVQTRGGKLPVPEALDICMQLCTVLDYLHNRQPSIIFRDLKPLNIMRDLDGHLYLIDFGIARHFKVGQPGDTRIGYTPGYAAPEQYGLAQTTPRSDIYSLGATLHQLLSGNHPSRTPFLFAPLRLQGYPNASDLEKLILQMVEMDENRRLVSMKVVKQELQRIATQGVGKPTNPLQSADSKPHASSSQPTPVIVKQKEPVQAQKPTPPRYNTPKPHITTPVTPKPTGIPPTIPAIPVKRRVSRRTIVLGLAGLAVSSCGIAGWLNYQNVGTTLYFTYTGHSTNVEAVAWSPDGSYIASGDGNGVVQVWQAATGDHVFTYSGHSGTVNAIAWSSNSKHIASASNDTTVQVWNAFDGSNPYIYRGHSNDVNGVAWSPDGTRIVSGSYDKTARVWNTTDGSDIYVYRGHANDPKDAGFVWDIAWSPDGQYIASAGSTVRVWNSANGSDVYTYQGHSMGPDALFQDANGIACCVRTVAWSPDSRRIVSGSDEKTVHVWNAVDGSNVFTYGGYNRDFFITLAMGGMAWSPDSKRIASGGKDVQVWQVPS